jgi:predicted PurR-regulated permease PerM
MAVSSFGIGNPFATLGGGPYQGIGSYNPAAILPQVVQLLQIVPQHLQQLQQLEWAQQQQLQQIQQLFHVVASQVQQVTQQLGAQGSSFGAIAPQFLTSPYQTMLSPSAFTTQPLHVM